MESLMLMFDAHHESKTDLLLRNWGKRRTTFPARLVSVAMIVKCSLP